MDTNTMAESHEYPWIDVSVPLQNGVTSWPGDPQFRIERISDMKRGDAGTLSAMYISAHCGTHMDAPAHCLVDGKMLDALPITATVGPARVIEITHTGAIGAEELAAYDFCAGARIIFKTNNSQHQWYSEPYRYDYVHLHPDAAQLLSKRHVQLVGIDYLSVGSPDEEGTQVHRILMEAGIWLLEGLYLAQVDAGNYDLVCLPLRLVDVEGAPARVIMRKA
jgi:arylformamidase